MSWYYKGNYKDDKRKKHQHNKSPNICYKNKSHWRDCKGKKRWSDYNGAAKYAKHIGLRVYYCEYCNGYHLSSRQLKEYNNNV